MFWLFALFIAGGVVFLWKIQTRSGQQGSKLVKTRMDQEIQQHLEQAGLEVTDELVYQVKKMHQTSELALGHFKGNGVAQDYKKAYELWSEIAGVLPLANVFLGTMEVEGLMGKKNPQLAMSYFHKALQISEYDCPEAMFQIARLYYLGEGVVQNYSQAYQWTQRAADLGYDEAEYQLGWLSYEGYDTEQNRAKAFIKWLALAKKGHVDAKRSLGFPCYFLGHGTGKNLEQAFYWTNLAAQEGSVDAEANLGFFYMYGYGTATDLNKARHWLEKASSQQHVQARTNLATLLLMQNENDPEHIRRAIELWQSIVDVEENAQNNLGLLYLYGCRGLASHYAKALPYLQQSAEKGNSTGCVGYAVCLVKIDTSEQNLQIARDYVNRAIAALAQQSEEYAVTEQATFGLLGNVYLDNEIFPKDVNRALQYLEKSAQLNHSFSQFLLATLYAEGKEVIQDDTKAAYWYQKAAESGDIGAQNNLGAFYALGRGVAQDYSQAYYWFEQAMQKGDADAINNMGEMYENGYGVTQDYAKALQLFEQANVKGSVDSSFNLGNLYFYGRGVAQDAEKAKHWYQKALTQQHPKARAIVAQMQAH